MADKTSQAVSQASDSVGKISENISGRISGGGPDLTAQAKGALTKWLQIGGGFANAAMAAAQKLVSAVRGTSAGSYFAADGVGGGGAGAAVAAAAVVAVAAGAATVGRGNADGAAEGAEAIGAGGSSREGAALEDEAGRLQPIGGSAAGGEVAMEVEGQLLQPVGVKLETGAENDGKAGTTQPGRQETSRIRFPLFAC